MTTQRQATLLFLLRDDQILLAMKKRGFGAGRWNGVGGKPEANETIEQTAVRECKEEIGVTPKNYHQVGTLNFHFADKTLNQQVIVYLCTTWAGTPRETEEMRPQWFKTRDIPYDAMWPDDALWLPKVLAGSFVEGSFTFNDKDVITKHTLTTRQL